MTKAHKPGTLKQAIDELVERCGGRKTVAALWSCSLQHVARMVEPEGDACPRVDQILQAEAVCGDPIVTRFLAGERGCFVEQVRTTTGRPLALILGKITTEFGELLSAAAVDAAKGNLPKPSAAMLIDETDDVIGALVEFRAKCREARDRP